MRIDRTRSLLWAILFLLMAIPGGGAFATFSIVAIDPDTREIGSAGASCIGGVIIISDIVPGIGAIHSQAFVIQANKTLARQRLEAGDSPQEIMAFLEANDAGGNPRVRQYGAVAYHQGEIQSAAFTGSNTISYAGHITGPNYAIQGNILLGQEILENMEKAFVEAEGELADKLMAAMLAANVPGADTRCRSTRRPSISAFVRVNQPTDGGRFYLDLNVDNTASNQNPIDILQSRFDAWKLLPRASFTVTPERGPDPLEVVVDASPSSVVEGATIESYEWDFGDGESGMGEIVAHTYALPGRYVITLTVTDDQRRRREESRAVTVTVRAGPLEPWTAVDIGALESPGGARIEGDCIFMAGSGRGFTSRSDQLLFVYREIEENFTLTARVSELLARQGRGEIGIALRASVDTDSAFAAMTMRRTSSSDRPRFRWRPAAGASARSTRGDSAELPDIWVRITRQGNHFTGSTSRDKVTWAELGAQSVDIPDTVLAGLVLASTTNTQTVAGRVCSIEITPAGTSFRRGDANADGTGDVSDGIFILNWLFGESDAPPCLDAADVDDSGKIDISDAVRTFNRLFLGGAPHPPPWPDCGADPSGDGLGCAVFGPCP